MEEPQPLPCARSALGFVAKRVGASQGATRKNLMRVDGGMASVTMSGPGGPNQIRCAPSTPQSTTPGSGDEMPPALLKIQRDFPTNFRIYLDPHRG
ncbi:hypothetical protein PAHAL_2G364500 [Panicum hallii]|uniref:Uncharacterized protein n=1 Tax=Panicum hallii TaxID=206008 RepID=A0A2T8KRQ3_9POAL|nr:hypothetical protein PAHAL_2G364500 [Panicum hallii]